MSANQRLPRLLITVIAPEGAIANRVDLQPTERITIGRSADCDLVLRDYGTKISRQHAVLSTETGRWMFHNLGVNGTYENGQRIEHSSLSHGSAYRLSRCGPILRFQFQSFSSNIHEDLVPHDEQSLDGSDAITEWMQQLRAGNEEAELELWKQYAGRIGELARRTLKHSNSRVIDEEDIVIITIKSLLAGIRAGRFAQLDHRDQLWRLLAVITTRKAAAALHQDRRQKRGGGHVRGDSAVMIKIAPQSDQIHRDDSNILKSPGDSDLEKGFDQFEAVSTTPDIAVLMADQAAELMRHLPDDVSRRLVTLKLDGHTHEEIAERLQCTVRTVERRLKQVREIWLRLADGA